MKKRLLILLCFPMIGFGQQTYVPDDDFENFLENNLNFITGSLMGNGIANDDSVTTSNINTATHLMCHLLDIHDLTGIEDFSALEVLWCFNNQLTSLDISNNTVLTELRCDGNQLISLDVSSNTALNFLNCQDNQLTSLDVSSNTALNTLRCYDNQLTNLDVRNGNNINFSNFYSHNNPNLFCINVDDAVWSTTNWSNIDPQHYFSNNCPPSATQEYTTKKELLKVTGLLGRETKGKKNEPLFYLYDDGTVEKRIIID